MLPKFHNAYLYFCSHVLPLVYDESLSYYEVLCKLAEQMRFLWESQNEVIKITEAAKEIVDVLFPELKEEINEKLAEYEEAYQQYTDKWDEALKKAEDDIAEFGKTLTEGLANQDKAIQDNNAAQLELINTRLGAQDEKLAAQDNKITRLQETTSSKLAQQEQKLEDFINNYNPVRVMLPEVIVTTNENANITAVSPAGERTEKAVQAGTPTTFICPAYGSWTFTAVSQLGREEQTLNIDDVKQYTLTFDIEPPTVYTIDITPHLSIATAALCFNAGVYQITGPNSYSQSFTSTANSTLNVEVEDPGEYTVEWKAANVVVDGDRIVNTGTSRIYTTVYLTQVNLSAENNSAKVQFTPPIVRFMFTGMSLPQGMYITPPTVTEQSTLIEVNTQQYYIIPWVTGQWLFGQTDGIEKGYTFTTLTGNYSFDLAPEKPVTTGQKTVQIPWRGELSSTDRVTPADASQTQQAAVRLRGMLSDMGCLLCGMSESGKLVGYIVKSELQNDGTYKYYYEDDTDFLPDLQYIGLYIPSFGFGLHVGTNDTVEDINIVTARNDNNTMFKDYTTKKSHAGIVVPISGVDEATDTLKHGIPKGASNYSKRVTSPTLLNSLPPNCEVIRLEQALLFIALRIGAIGGMDSLLSASTLRAKPTYDLTWLASSDGMQLSLAFMPHTFVTLQTSLTSLQYADAGNVTLKMFSNTQRYTSSPSMVSGRDSFPNSFARLLFPIETSVSTGNMAPGFYGSPVNSDYPLCIRGVDAGYAYRGILYQTAQFGGDLQCVFYVD